MKIKITVGNSSVEYEEPQEITIYPAAKSRDTQSQFMKTIATMFELATKAHKESEE